MHKGPHPVASPIHAGRFWPRDVNNRPTEKWPTRGTTVCDPYRALWMKKVKVGANDDAVLVLGGLGR